MKKIFYLSCLFLLYGCVFSYDPARGLLRVRNNSSEAVYVYLNYGNADSLPLVSGLELFAFINANKEDAYAIGGSRNKPSFPSNENEVTLFFITEKTMRSYDLEDIHMPLLEVKKHLSDNQ